MVYRSVPTVPTRRRRVLIVDDDPVNLEMIELRLSHAGFEVRTATGGREAIERIAAEVFDLVLLDVMMPEVDGFEVLAAVRPRLSSLELPVIMVTAMQQHAETVRALGLGANDYVTKPIDFPVLLARVETQLSLRRLSSALRESEERYALAFRAANDGLYDWDIIKQETYYGTRFSEIIGCQKEALGTEPLAWMSRVHPDDVEALGAALDRRNHPGVDQIHHECRVVRSEGNVLWVAVRALVVRGDDGRAIRLVGSLTDITSTKVIDPLTRLPNRSLFMDRIQRALGIARRSQGSFAILCAKLQRMGSIHDAIGPAAVEKLILAASERLSRLLRREDCATLDGSYDSSLTRLQGGHFAILVENLERVTDATKVAERIRDAFDEPIEVSGERVYASIAVGIAFGPEEYGSAEEALRDASTALSRAKEDPRRIAICEASMSRRAIELLALENDLRQAIERGELRLHYQPIYGLDPRRLVGVEALLRWPHPRRGLVSPSVFIPIAEEAGIIGEIGRWVFREACRQSRCWTEAGRDLVIAVNFSVAQFGRPGLVDMISATIRETGADPKRLLVEVTESVLAQRIDELASDLEKISMLGLGIAIDDFGTGYSSLMYLSTLPITNIKIDRHFVRDIVTNSGSRALAGAIVTMGHQLGLTVTAEGIETREQLDALARLGCDRAQGYFLGHPQAPELALEPIALF
ncbi:MAG: EAL domain-containing protein [Deltaproteobacteria bacterium]|nr:EAL domain-containing protein [Deltaproteobacteria bacterium]